MTALLRLQAAAMVLVCVGLVACATVSDSVPVPGSAPGSETGLQPRQSAASVGPPMPSANPSVEVATVFATPLATPSEVAIPVPMPGVLPPAPPADLWQRMRQGFRLEAVGNGPLAEGVAAQVRDYQRQSAGLTRTFMRGRSYLYDIVQILEAEKIPLEIALLPALESAYQTQVCSHAAACGLWQFIASTARRFDLKQHLFVDERKHVRAATLAAVRYLKELHLRFGGDWQLALAAYNCGEGCIEAAVRRAQARGLPGRFADLKLNPETAQYVPRLLALAQVVADPAASQISLPAMPNAAYFAPVPIERDIDVALAARFAGMSAAEFAALNPQHKKPVIVATGDTQVFVPSERAAQFHSRMGAHAAPLSSWGVLKLSQNSRVEAIAKQLKTSVELLREVNGIGSQRLVGAGSTLVVPLNNSTGTATGQGDIGAVVATSAVLVTLPFSTSKKYMKKKMH